MGNGDKVSGSRLGRLARIGWLSGKAVPVAWQRLKETADAPAKLRGQVAAKLFERHSGLAEEAFKTLGDMKGVALKVGQMLSYMDGALPLQYQPVYREMLSRLQQAAPALPWRTVEPVLVAELGAPVADRFAAFDEAPFAAASIGQVHRARLHDGTEVAVKIQYPGIERAMTSDLKNADLFRSMLTPFIGAIGGGKKTRSYVKDIMAEMRARLMEELDYEREAQMQERFRELLADQPGVRIPRVFPEHSSRRVLTSEFMAGRSLQEVCDTDDGATKNAYAEVLTGAMLRCLYDFSLFNADPHPGNYLFGDDGTVVLLDFGCVKEIPAAMNRDMRDALRLAIAATRSDAPADWAAFDEAACRALQLDPDNEIVFELYREFLLYVLRPALRDAPFAFTSEFGGESIERVLDGIKQTVFQGRKLPRIPDIPPVPADYTFINRLQWGFFSILTMLDAEINWHRLLPPDLRG
jgi:predicted unusual protein kinase regulating ubiquinone biosynthesis (AarF/ABC1/UbiB family)